MRSTTTTLLIYCFNLTGQQHAVSLTTSNTMFTTATYASYHTAVPDQRFSTISPPVVCKGLPRRPRASEDNKLTNLWYC